MTEGGWLEALGNGWLGKMVLMGLAGAAAWFARRPVEHAETMKQVNARLDTAFKSMEKQLSDALARCGAVEKQLKDERDRCDQELASMRAETAAMRAEISKLMSEPIAEYTTITRQPPRSPTPRRRT